MFMTDLFRPLYTPYFKYAFVEYIPLRILGLFTIYIHK